MNVEPGQRLSGRQILAMTTLAIVFGAPAIVCVEGQIGPGRWIVGFQDAHLGFHLPVVSMALIVLLEMLAVGAVLLVLALAVRLMTGRTIVQLLAKQER